MEISETMELTIQLQKNLVHLMAEKIIYNIKKIIVIDIILLIQITIATYNKQIEQSKVVFVTITFCGKEPILGCFKLLHCNLHYLNQDIDGLLGLFSDLKLSTHYVNVKVISNI